MIDLSPVVHSVEVAALKVIIAMTIFTLAYAAVFFGMKKRVNKQLARLAAQFVGGLSAVGVMYIAFGVLGHS
ncbi:hypothetical protein [Paraburkholderia sacchari]|uniref:hypothetical protein n=1 Tax=Paraburkholderia sacchari TaxID=159450 RepID=UPI00054288B4|nr:hypothetical protein [Paraburkholderia sacchari]NLP65519.1 hypothetical protein [Paraburkholderia sacchari]